MDNIELIKLANAAKENAYTPYSNFKVGAAIVTEDGKVFTGCNIENASYGGTNCAERTALFKALSEGHRKFTKIAVISDSSDYTYPCGICRQVLSEFSLNLEVIVANQKLEYKVHKLSELLPYAFTNKDLERR
ncbi:cytidine deaminase [Caloramator quimbayensis]|uniref:Cytidine deaminase n=1 Tax=Caloramator quimbayensis TaxID=1147123 RepID=A0A1T4X938_9CLOT|nr:cytidine deaminase [Caloramator quimbayensis]SKA85957.1 cytidine deaminase [Caloramator quimbayensis]